MGADAGPDSYVICGDMLLILGGLPGTGKTTLARELARQLGAVHLRIDSIEQTLLQSGAARAPLDDAGYRIGYLIAEDNLHLGLTVIADCVNPLRITRDAWRDVASRTQVVVVEIEVTCSDVREHRRRVETRTTDFPGGSRLPTWPEVVARDYQPWEGHRIVIDTADASVEENVNALLAAIAARRSSARGS